jgi:hypothetical protein
MPSSDIHYTTDFKIWKFYGREEKMGGGMGVVCSEWSYS